MLGNRYEVVGTVLGRCRYRSGCMYTYLHMHMYMSMYMYMYLLWLCVCACVGTRSLSVYMYIQQTPELWISCQRTFRPRYAGNPQL